MTRYPLPIALFLLVAAVGRAGETSAEWGPAFKGLRMSIRLEKPRYRADEPIRLDLAIKNTSNEDVALGMSAEDMASFEIAVSLVESYAGAMGRMPLTKLGARRVAPFDAKKNIKIRLKPGEERSYRFPLDRLYDMTIEGEYTVVANRAVPGRFRYDSDGHMEATEGGRPSELVSNELRLLISDFPPEK